MKTARSAAFMLAGGLMVACSGNANAVEPLALDTTVAVPSTTTSAATTAPSTTVAVTTAPPTAPTVTTVEGPSGPTFSDALGIKVPTAPGVNTTGDTRQLLPEGLYVHIAWQPDPADPSVYTVQPGDEEILEAYANASMTFHRAAAKEVTTDAADFDTYYVDGGAQYDENFRQARDAGYIGTVGSGIVLRPYVLADQRTETTAVVLDCTLDDGEFILLAGGKPNPDPPTQKGLIATMRMVEGSWKVEATGGEDAACL